MDDSPFQSAVGVIDRRALADALAQAQRYSFSMPVLLNGETLRDLMAWLGSNEDLDREPNT